MSVCLKVHSSIEKGVNFFDTSPFYGCYVSETVVGKCLKGIPRDKFYISTKCGRYARGIGTQDSYMDFTAKGVTQSVYDSLKRLQLDYLDIIHVSSTLFRVRRHAVW